MRNVTKTYSLDAAGVDGITEDLAGFFAAQKIEKRTALRARLAMEALLLRVMDADGAPETCTLTMGARFGAATVSVQYGGAAFDPTETGDEWSVQLLANLGLAPVWSCRRDVNIVRLRVPKASGGELLNLLFAVLAAAAIGAMGGALPDSFRAVVNEALLTPMFNAFIGLLTALAGPLILLTVASGVVGVGDTRVLQKLGASMFLRYVLISVVLAVCSALIVSRVFPLETAATNGESQLPAIMRLFFDILPTNPITPFLETKMMQIIVLAIFLGVAILALGERAGSFLRFVEEGSWVLQWMMGQVCRLVPLFVFVSLLQMIWGGSAGHILGLWKPILLFLLLLLLAAAAELVMAAWQTKTPVGLLFRKVLPQTLISLTTASSMAAFDTSVRCCEHELGIDKHFAGFALPVGTVIFMPTTAISLALFDVYFAHIFGVAADRNWYVLACLLAAVLAIATPPAPGAALTVSTIMLAQLGIPAEGLALIAAANVVLDFPATAGNVAMRDLELVRQADALHILDRDTLHRA